MLEERRASVNISRDVGRDKTYEIVECTCADGVDQMDYKLENKYYEDERRHRDGFVGVGFVGSFGCCLVRHC